MADLVGILVWWFYGDISVADSGSEADNMIGAAFPLSKRGEEKLQNCLEPRSVKVYTLAVTLFTL